MENIIDFKNFNINENNDNEYETNNFVGFVSELEDLAKKYNVTIRATGGVSVLGKNQHIKEIEYSQDPTSGDLDIGHLIVNNDGVDEDWNK